MPKHYTIKPQVTPLPGKAGKGSSAESRRRSAKQGTAPGSASEQPANDPFKPRDPYIRAENEDDDGYDPYSDRPPTPEPLFQEDPWD